MIIYSKWVINEHKGYLGDKWALFCYYSTSIYLSSVFSFPFRRTFSLFILPPSLSLPAGTNPLSVVGTPAFPDIPFSCKHP